MTQYYSANVKTENGVKHDITMYVKLNDKWFPVWTTNEMSNDYAYTDLRELSVKLDRNMQSLPKDIPEGIEQVLAQHRCNLQEVKNSLNSLGAEKFCEFHRINANGLAVFRAWVA